MKVMTVTGLVPVEELGVILPHEHLIMAFDWPGLWPEVSHRPDLVNKKVSIENLGELRRNYCAVRDNAILDDIDEISSEVELFKKAGGGTIIEMSTYGLYGNPQALKEISLKTGVYIIAGTGFYLDQTYPEDIKNMEVEDMYRIMVRDLTEGFPGTDVKAGIIGEVGISVPITPAEERSLRAAARAQRDTGAAMNIHIGFSIDLCRKAFKIIEEEGANFKKVVFAHCDGNSLEVNREITEKGICFELDCFGNEFYVDNGSLDSTKSWYFGSDGDRVKKIKEMVDNGLAGKMLLSQDVCSKMQLVRYGGYGYAHLLDNIVPMLENSGIPRETSYRIMQENTAGFLIGN